VDADDTELMNIVKDVMEMLSKRPTERPSDSSDGPTSTPPSSEDDSSSRIIRRFEQEGRPDLALMVVMETQEFKAAHSAPERRRHLRRRLRAAARPAGAAGAGRPAGGGGAGGGRLPRPKEGLPSVHEQRERLDAALVEEPKPLTPADLERLELLRVLGVAT
jgi:hypothetical protein